MPSTNLSGKTKADLVVLAELSGLLTAANAKKMTKGQLLSFLNEAEQKEQETDKSQEQANAASSTNPTKSKMKETKATAKPRKASASSTSNDSKTQNNKEKADEAKTKPQAAKSEAVEAKTKPQAAKSKSVEAKTKPKPQVAKTKAVEAKSKPKAAKVEAIEIETEHPLPQAMPVEAVTTITDTETKQATIKVKATRSRSTKNAKAADINPAAVQSTESATETTKAAPTEADTKPVVAAPAEPTTETAKAAPDKPKTRGRKKTVKPDTTPADIAATAQKHSTENLSVSPVEAEAVNKDENAKPDQPEQPVRSDDDQTKNVQQENNEQKQFAQQNQNVQRNTAQINKQKRPIVEQGEIVSGALEIISDGYGFLRKDNYLQGTKDIYVPPQYIRRFNLRTGDYITGPGKLQRENDRYQALLYVKEVNGMPPDKMIRRPQFDKLTPIYPDERYRLETARNELSTRIIDLAAPIGKGQRGMIVSPPKAGKTILLQKIANAISVNNPEVKLIVLLIDERPEEVTDMQRSIKGEVVYSTFDKTPENHVKVTELVLERAMRLVELKQDVVILLDSMTRLARAYNLTINPTGRTLSGGLDPGALYGPKRFFGAARNIENGGSLTIIATSLIETGSRMDEVIFEEFKGTGNMEVYLDRKLSEKRIFPAIDINRSGTRREELLMTEKELDAVWSIRKAFSQLDTAAVTETIINLLLKTQNNEHFISSINVSFNDKSIFEAMRGNRPSGNGQQNQNTMNNGSAR